MDWKTYFGTVDEKPLDQFPQGISNTAIFRTIGFIGDSLSSGEFESRDAEGNKGYHDYFEYSWGQYIARKNGLTAYNFSRGGMTAMEYMESFADANRFWRPEVACQAYVIALGVNDLVGRKMEIGSTADIHPEDWTQNQKTFAGYYAMIIARLQKMQPRGKFFLVGMPKCDDEERNAIARAHTALLYEMAAYFGNCYVIDLYQYGPVYDADFRERFYLYGHLNASGYILTANMVDAYIDYIVRHDPESFRLVPYIGTDLQ